MADDYDDTGSNGWVLFYVPVQAFSYLSFSWASAFPNFILFCSRHCIPYEEKCEKLGVLLTRDDTYTYIAHIYIRAEHSLMRVGFVGLFPRFLFQHLVIHGLSTASMSFPFLSSWHFYIVLFPCRRVLVGSCWCFKYLLDITTEMLLNSLEIPVSVFTAMAKTRLDSLY